MGSVASPSARSVGVRRPRELGPRALSPAFVALALVLLTAGSIVLRTGGLGTGYWIDEGIAVGIASYRLDEIPRALLQDGSPPLYYLLLHGWMAVVGTGEAATRSLSLVFACLTVPAAWWSGRALFGLRAGALAATAAATCPFLTYYAQETRMYSLVALLSLLASASFVLAFLRGDRTHLRWLVLWVGLLLYTHTWGVFLACGMGVAWLLLRRTGRVETRDGLRVGAVLALVYLPWLPSVLSQAAHTAAPWAEPPSPLKLLAIPDGLFGATALPLLVLAVATVLYRRRDVPDAVRILFTVTAVTAAVAWLCSQAQPAWATRYLAVLLGPFLLALAGLLSRGSRWTALALAAVAVVWTVTGSPSVKSNARTVAADVEPAIGAGDVVLSTQPEQVPVLYRYLPRGVAYITPLGAVTDPRLTDWRDGVARLRKGQATRVLSPLVASLRRGRRILLVTPVRPKRPSQAPWSRSVRVRTREWRRALREDPRLQAVDAAPSATFPHRRSTVRAEVFEVR